MLIYDASYREENKSGAGLSAYLNGKITMDAEPSSFKEEDHPRGKEGTREGGKFVKSNKTIEKEDDLDSQIDSKRKAPEKTSKPEGSHNGWDYETIEKNGPIGMLRAYNELGEKGITPTVEETIFNRMQETTGKIQDAYIYLCEDIDAKNGTAKNNTGIRKDLDKIFREKYK